MTMLSIEEIFPHSFVIPQKLFGVNTYMRYHQNVMGFKHVFPKVMKPFVEWLTEHYGAGSSEVKQNTLKMHPDIVKDKNWAFIDYYNIQGVYKDDALLLFKNLDDLVHFRLTLD